MGNIRYKSVFFDFDGVIVDSVGIKTEAFYRLYLRFSKEAAGEAVKYHLANGGMSRFKKINHVHKTVLGIELTESETVNLSDEFSRMVEDAVAQSPYIVGALESLRLFSSDLPLAVISGTPELELRRILEKRQLTSFFRWIYGSPRSKTEAFKEILSLSGMKANEVVYVGDALNDYDSAKETGMDFVGVGDGMFPAGTKTIPDLHKLRDALV